MTVSAPLRRTDAPEALTTYEECIGESNCQAAVKVVGKCIYRSGERCIDPQWRDGFNRKYDGVEVRT